MIPDDVRARDLIGYGPEPPAFAWPDDATVVINLVVVYEEGSEASVRWDDARNEGWGEYPSEGPQPPHLDHGTEGHYDYGSRAGIWRLARLIDEAGVPATVSATATALELNPAVAEWMNARDHDLLGHGWRWLPPHSSGRFGPAPWMLNCTPWHGPTSSGSSRTKGAPACGTAFR